MNLCFDALDRPLIAGRADEIAARGSFGELRYAVLLERVAALAGLFRGLGVTRGSTVRTALSDPLDEMLAILATSRLGAVLVDADHAGPADLYVGDDHGSEPLGMVRVLKGGAVTDPTTEIDWNTGLRAGREDPAASVEVEGTDPAFVIGGETVTVAHAAAHPSWPGRVHAALAIGDTVDLTRA